MKKPEGWYEKVSSRDFDVEDIPHGWIQWKGTNVCMDVHCACGSFGHIDAEFCYQTKCLDCGRVYAMGANVKMIELAPEEIFDEDAQVREDFKDHA